MLSKFYFAVEGNEVKYYTNEKFITPEDIKIAWYLRSKEELLRKLGKGVVEVPFDEPVIIRGYKRKQSYPRNNK